MPDGDWELPVFGEDYGLERWTDGSKDGEGNLVWHDEFPKPDQWASITQVTLDLDPNSRDGDFRNFHIDPDRPLDPWGEFHDRGEPDDWFDLDDFAGEVLDAYEIAYG